MAHTIHNPQQALTQARMIWVLLMIGVVMMAAIGVFIARGADLNEPHGQRDSDAVVLFVAVAAPFVLIPLGIYLRGQTFKRGWVGDVVTPSAYLGGCVLAWAMADAAAIFGVGAMILSQRVMPNVLPIALSLAALAAMWPNGRAMFPSDSGGGPVGERRKSGF